MQKKFQDTSGKDVFRELFVSVSLRSLQNCLLCSLYGYKKILVFKSAGEVGQNSGIKFTHARKSEGKITFASLCKTLFSVSVTLSDDFLQLLKNEKTNSKSASNLG